MQLPERAAQQAAVGRILHKRVLKAIDHVWRRASLKDQLGKDEASQSALQFVLGKTGDGT